MERLDRDSIDFGKGSIPRLFTQIFIPTLAGMIFSVIFVITDGIFVGHGIGSNGLAAVNLIMPLFTVATGMGMMLAAGVSVVASIHLAKGNGKAARINVTQAFAAAIVTGILLSAVLYCWPTGIMRLMGANDILMPLCLDYLLWFIPDLLFVMLQFVGQFVIRLDGSPKYSMLVQIIPASINVILDYSFIFPLDMGMKGAALATCLSGGISVVMVFWYMFFRCRSLNFYRLKMSATSLVLSLRNIGYMIKLGFSGFLGEFASSATMLAGNYMFMEMLGEDGVAAFSVACYLIPIVFMAYSAISQSAQPIVSFNFGRGDASRVGRTFRLCLILSAGMGILFTALMWAFSGPVVGIFLDEGSPARLLSEKGFPLYASGFVFMAVNLTVIGYLQSIEKAVAASIITLFRGILFPVIAMLLLPRAIGTPGLWFAVPLAELLSVVMILLFFRKDLRITTIDSR